jgi:hypothetical protein
MGREGEGRGNKGTRKGLRSNLYLFYIKILLHELARELDQDLIRPVTGIPE